MPDQSIRAVSVPDTTLADLGITPVVRLTNYRGRGPDPVSAEYPVHVRYLEPNGVELALHLTELPRLGTALREAACNAPSDLVARVAAAVAVALKS
jgi:hypothetical protein